MYPMINGTEIGGNLMLTFVYANSVTHGWAVPLITISFFILILISSAMMQLRFTSRMRFETSLLAASFATLGFATILEQQTGLLNPVYFFIIIGITILSLLWVALGES
jgi:hypothetical protein